MKANQRCKVFEEKLIERTAALNATRKELTQVNEELKKLKAQPIIHSESLKVIKVFVRFKLMLGCLAS